MFRPTATNVSDDPAVSISREPQSCRQPVHPNHPVSTHNTDERIFKFVPIGATNLCREPATGTHPQEEELTAP
jgi:hypothetical protein